MARVFVATRTLCSCPIQIVPPSRGCTSARRITWIWHANRLGEGAHFGILKIQAQPKTSCSRAMERSGGMVQPLGAAAGVGRAGRAGCNAKGSDKSALIGGHAQAGFTQQNLFLERGAACGSDARDSTIYPATSHLRCPVPLPIAGTGLAGLVRLGALVRRRRKRSK